MGEGGGRKKPTGYPKSKRKETQSRRRQRTFAERLNGMSLISIGAVDKCLVPSPTKSQILFYLLFLPSFEKSCTRAGAGVRCEWQEVAL